MTPRVVTRPLPRAERRAVILTGAARVFASGGFDATSMEDIAEAAGVTKLILYRHFESKEELYRAILESVSSRLADEIRSTLGSGRRQGVFGPVFLGVARDDPDEFRLLWRHSSREPRFASYAAEVRGASIEFARSLLSGRVAPPLLDWAAATSVDFLVGAVLNWLDQGDPADDELFLDVVGRSLGGLVSVWAE